MLATFDLPAVRHFTEDLKERQRRCDNGEGMICSDLDATINYHMQLCQELRHVINDWAQAVFTGQVAFDPAVEALLKVEVQDLLPHAKKIAAQGREKNWQCFELSGLNKLHYYVVDLDYLLAHWVSPRPAIGPAPRVKVPDAAAQQIAERLANLPPLPHNWRPGDPTQFARFKKETRE
jgi:hypothetical protein